MTPNRSTTRMFAAGGDIRRTACHRHDDPQDLSEREQAMDRWQWLLRVILTLAALTRLLTVGRRNGWI
jgi:hypothetical protein